MVEFPVEAGRPMGDGCKNNSNLKHWFQTSQCGAKDILMFVIWTLCSCFCSGLNGFSFWCGLDWTSIEMQFIRWICLSLWSDLGGAVWWNCSSRSAEVLVRYCFSFVPADVVGERHQRDPGGWDGAGKDHPVHRSYRHDDRENRDGPLLGGGPSFDSAQLDQWVQAVHTRREERTRSRFWFGLLGSDLCRICLRCLCCFTTAPSRRGPSCWSRLGGLRGPSTCVLWLSPLSRSPWLTENFYRYRYML